MMGLGKPVTPFKHGNFWGPPAVSFRGKTGDIPQHSPVVEILYLKRLRMSRLDVYNIFTLEKTVGN